MTTVPTDPANSQGSIARQVGLFGLVLAVLALTAFALVRAPGPLVDKLLEDDMRGQADLWRKRVVTLLRDGNATFRKGQINAGDQGFLEMITRSSEVYRFKLIDAQGVVFWSSRASDIGKGIDANVMDRISTDRTSLFFLMAKPASEIDAIELHATRIDVNAPRTVAEIYTPIIQDGIMLGAIEFYNDVTEDRDSFVIRIRTLLAFLAAVIGILFVATFSIVQRTGRARLRDVNALARSEREIMSNQLQLTREVRLLGELNEWLQSSRSLGELFEMVARFMTHMLPTCEGSVYVYSNSRDVLDGCSSWNGATHKAHIHPDECWGLRRGRTYVFGDSEIDFTCAHSEPHDGRPYICFPILAHGETVGLMHLRARCDTDKAAFMASRKLAQMSAEQISMAIANVRMRDQLQDQSIRDPLTGLYNRRHLTESLRRSLNARQRSGAPLAVVAIDIDHFKRFNDNHGHDAGDMVLRAVAAALGLLCDRDELACRIGGEELMVMLPATTGPEAMARAEAMRAAVEAVTVRYGEKTLPRVTISLGVAVAPDHGALPQDLMLIADNALYKAKAAGRNQVMLAELRSAEPAVPQVGLAPPAAMPNAQPDHPTAIAAA